MKRIPRAGLLERVRGFGGAFFNAVSDVAGTFFNALSTLLHHVTRSVCGLFRCFSGTVGGVFGCFGGSMTGILHRIVHILRERSALQNQSHCEGHSQLKSHECCSPLILFARGALVYVSRNPYEQVIGIRATKAESGEIAASD